MKIVSSLFAVVAVVATTVKSQDPEMFDCYAEDVGVTNKTTCDTWCGGVGAYTGTYVTDNGMQTFTGLSCECTDKNDPNAPPAEKMCEGTYEVPDCYDVGVKNKPTCDTWCGGTGAYTGSISGDTYNGHMCECTDKNSATPEPVTQYCKGAYTTPTCKDAGVTGCDQCGAYCLDTGVGATQPDGTSTPYCEGSGDALGCKCGVDEGTAVYACSPASKKSSAVSMTFGGIASLAFVLSFALL